MFLPTLRVCGQPTAMVEWPIFWTPYVVGALVFSAALVAPGRLGALALALRIIIGMTLAGAAMLFGIGEPREHNVLMVLGAAAVVLAILAIAVPARTPEAMVARLGFVTGVATLPWFFALVMDPGGLWGAEVSLWSAAVFAAANLWWWIEATVRPIAAAQRRGYRRSM